MSGGPTFMLSAFADEISKDLKTQLRVLKEQRVPGIDVRSVNGVNVTQLDDRTLDTVKSECESCGIFIQAVGSPVNKVEMSPMARREEVEKLRKSIHAAQRLGTHRIRIFSPELSEAEWDLSWPDVRDWMREMVDMAGEANMLLLHENDGKFFGAYPDNARKLLEAFHGQHFAAIFDFANTVLLGFDPVADWLPWIVPYLDTLHIKDADRSEKRVVPAGQGDGRMVEFISTLVQQGWQGTLTLEPHLRAGGPYGGDTGEELFATAVNAIRDVVARSGGSC